MRPMSPKEQEHMFWLSALPCLCVTPPPSLQKRRAKGISSGSPAFLTSKSVLYLEGPIDGTMR